MTVSAETEQSATPSEPTADAFILDDGTAMTMELSEIETADTGNIYVYEVEYDGVLDHTIEVDLENDEAVMTYADGRTETLVISEHVRVTKIQEAGAPSFSSVAAELLEPTPIIAPTLPASSSYTNYIYNTEPFEIDENGNQLRLNNFQYGFGYELVGYTSFTNPNETGYLLRKPMGYTVFNDRYYYEIEEHTALDLAYSILQTVVGITTNDFRLILEGLTSTVWTIAGEVVEYYTSGTIECREYRWDYRVRRNPYEATLLEVTKYRYWWCLTVDGSSQIAFEKRTDIVDGCQYPNIDIVAAGLGRIVIYV